MHIRHCTHTNLTLPWCTDTRFHNSYTVQLRNGINMCTSYTTCSSMRSGFYVDFTLNGFTAPIPVDFNQVKKLYTACLVYLYN